MSKQLALVSLALMALAGCSKDNQKYTYSYEVNGCDTGEQSAGSLEDHCKNLADDARNHYCADSMRKQTFDQECGGTGVNWN